MQDIYVQSEAEALNICRDLQSSNKADLFRGQSNDWPTIGPSIYREPPGQKRKNSEEKLTRFLEWCINVPQMNSYSKNIETLTAIAQHYGIPTPYLDLTTNPKIASIFAKPSSDSNYQRSVIYCFKEHDLISNKDFSLIKINVDNLWRLENQEGLFLHFINEDGIKKLRGRSIRIHFPSNPISDEEKLYIYPNKKSHLENIIDQWFYRIGIEDLFKKFDNSEIKTNKIVRRTYPGAFAWRKLPEFNHEWEGMISNWLQHHNESSSILNTKNSIKISTNKNNNIKDNFEEIKISISNELISSNNSPIKFIFEGLDNSLDSGASTLLGRVWDGIRNLPYTSEEKIKCIALCATLISLRAKNVDILTDWEEKLWGEIETIEVYPYGGHIEAACISRRDLISAFSENIPKKLSTYYRRKFIDGELEILNFVTDASILLNFEKFKKIYIEQFIPSAIDSFWKEDISHYSGSIKCFWSICFNPSHIATFAWGSYGPTSPLAFENHPESIIYIHEDMKEQEIKETMLHCWPQIRDQSKPFTIRFHGYHKDPRPVHKIEKIIMQTKIINSIGGLSPLRVIATNEEEINSNGLFAFHLWLMGNEKSHLIDNQNNKNIQMEYNKLINSLPEINYIYEKNANDLIKNI